MIDHLSSYNSIADEYEYLFPDYHASVPIWRTRFNNFFGFGKSKPFLDIGCGNGVQSVILSQQGFKVFAVDLSDLMIEKGRNLAKKYKQHITFIQGDCRELESILPSNLSFIGFVCCGSSILHFSPEDLKKLVKQLYNFLSNGSKGLIEFFNWSLVETENLKWTPRSHFRNNNIERFSLEFFYDRNRKVVSSIILLTRNWKRNESWKIKTQAEFIYWKYLPKEISEAFETGGFKIKKVSQGTKQEPTSIIWLKVAK